MAVVSRRRSEDINEGPNLDKFLTEKIDPGVWGFKMGWGDN